MNDREEGKSSSEPEKRQPSHRVSFARINGQDRQGHDILGPSREIGSIWERKGKEGEGILRFDHIPEEMRARGGGVLFISKVPERSDEKAPVKQRDTGRDR